MTRHVERREPTIAAGALVAESQAPEEVHSLDAVREVLLTGGQPSERDLARLLAAQVGLPFIDLATRELDAAAARLLPAGFCRRFALLPIGFDDGVLVVGVAHPSNDVAIDAARGLLRREIELVVVTRSELFAAMMRLDRPAAPTGVVPKPTVPSANMPASSSRRRPYLALAVAALCASTGLAALVVTNGRFDGEVLRPAAQPPRTESEATLPAAAAAPSATPGQAPAPGPGRTFAWVPAAEASSYAFQLERNSMPIFKALTPDPRFTLPPSWSYQGRRYRLEPGQLRWRVWALDASGRRLAQVVNATLAV